MAHLSVFVFLLLFCAKFAQAYEYMGVGQDLSPSINMFLNIINAARTTASVPTLCMRSDLQNVAQNYANLQLKFSDGGPNVNGTTVDDRVNSFGPGTVEILVQVQNSLSANQAFSILKGLNSTNDTGYTESYGSLLNSKYTSIGIGMASGADNTGLQETYSTYWVIELASNPSVNPCGAAPTADVLIPKAAFAANNGYGLLADVFVPPNVSWNATTSVNPANRTLQALNTTQIMLDTFPRIESTALSNQPIVPQLNNRMAPQVGFIQSPTSYLYDQMTRRRIPEYLASMEYD